ncbi:hypothetical protein JCM10207_008606 [Rhodosporidiobolus poonsookiae]
MRVAGLLLAVLQLWVLATASPGSSNSTHPPLFSPPPASLPFLHTSLASLLPVLPHLAPPPEHTLLVTLATPAFKPLLYNWLCFLRHKAKWGQPATHDIHGERVKDKKDEDKTGWEDTPKLLVITSDEDLANDLAGEGVVTWWLRGIDWDEFDAAEESGDEAALERLDAQLQQDLFTNLRLLDLLLPSEPPSSQSERLTDQLIPWGTLHYQSLMLERSLAMSALVGALVESQKTDARWQRQQDYELWQRVMAHDWENDGMMEMPEFVGVKGVLLVDNDAIWLSSPTPFLSHYYRPSAPHPSIIFAPDMSPTQQNAWGSHDMPCACFLYSRVSDHGARLASPPAVSPLAAAKATTLPAEEADPYLYSPAEGAAEAWRSTALCHISMLLQALETGRHHALVQRLHATKLHEGGQTVNPQLVLDKPKGEARAAAAAAAEEGEEESPGKLKALKKATAPSFQATALGPALFLSEQNAAHLPTFTHDAWLSALGSGDVDELLDALSAAGLTLGRPGAGSTCLALAQSYQTVCPAPPSPLSRLELLAALIPAPSSGTVARTPRPHRPIRTEPLPYDLFPPGMRFFDGGLEPGARPCVVHANYATGKKKEELLRGRGLWALVEPEGEGGELTCSAEVMARA